MIDRRFFAAAAFVALPALGGCMQGKTYGTGTPPGRTILSEMTGGLTDRNKNQEPVSYQPRAPLVMPPDGQLRQPVETAATEGGSWPDPNAAVGPGGGIQGETARDDLSPEDVRRLRPLAGLLPRGTNDLGDGVGDRDADIERKYETMQSQKQRQQFSADLAEAKGIGSTERRYLTDPPQDVREPAETAPTEFDKISKKDKKEKGFLSRLWPF